MTGGALWYQVAKMAALACVLGLVAAHFTGALTAATLAVAALWLLFVRAG